MNTNTLEDNATRGTKQREDSGPRYVKREYKIAVHPDNHPDNTRQGYVLGNLFGINAKTWDVTHIPTGRRMPGMFARLKDAKAYIADILPLAVWSELTDSNSHEFFPPIKPQILAAVKAHGI